MTAVKALRPTTIIPSDLYVDRQADRQLDAIVEDMGRPGYVLVARQMGKTNLLLAMKRRRTSRGDVVAYVDLSNRFASPRGLFRHLVDALLDAIEVGADDLRRQVDAVRVAAHEPNVEYDRSLRAILRAKSDTRFVIVLDEIDSLLNVTYSDAVLSQIRSMYFARGNYAEYYRLTYVLSGVVEPSSLIKDKHISPFNIGEKIYLGDFSKEEVAALAEKAGLSVEASVSERVYYWTGGNPRMTWDVFSSVEDLIISGSPVDSGVVDRVVERLYLTHFDRAPLDHIRDLVETNSQIREGIVAIRYGRPEALSSVVKSKLYLAGITTGESNDSTAIKNKIIDEALSDAWLHQIAQDKQDALRKGQQYFSAGLFADAVRAFEEYEADVSGAGLPRESRILLARSRIGARSWEKAVVDLRALLADEASEDAAELSYYLGYAYLELGEASDAIAPLRVAAAGYVEQNGLANLLLAVALLRGQPETGAGDAFELVCRVLSDGAFERNNSLATYKSWAWFIKGSAQLMLEQEAEAKTSFDFARDGAPPDLVPAVLYHKARLETNEAERVAYMEAAANAIVRDGLEIIETGDSVFGFDAADLATILAGLEELKLRGAFDQLLEHYIAKAGGFESKLDALVHICNAVSGRSARTVEVLLESGLARHVQISASDVYFKALRLLTQAVPLEKRRAAADRYFDAFGKLMSEALMSEDDLIVFAMQALSDYQSSDFARVERAGRLLDPYRSISIDLSPNFYVLFLSMEMQAYSARGRLEKAQELAAELLRLYGLIYDARNEFAAMLNSLRDAAAGIVQKADQRSPARKIGRNARVRVKLHDGREVRTKYKFVEADIRSGRTTLMEVLDSY
ncbi:AAA-like domain-containing protein [Caulobacter sp. CCH9-E1]|uniref:AAA-like domain-containing protein n=1 Tax=Caulobacter sp. CCH9-E1 TaxID=1768768 RepID=UPI00082E8F7D|nr:AAA-like domain-containing protein [Caulobacter sp. CCH9-E1]